ncbi:hypothetical protein BH20VER1_BH20VER1_18550 [soil metagenome]
MKVPVQFYSHLRDALGVSQTAADLAEGATVADLLTVLYSRYPRLREWESSMLIGAGVEFVGRDYLLQKGDDIAIMPPVQGG